MPDKIIGMMWGKNEGDILEEVVLDAIKHVDSIFIADGQSTDGSWEILKSLKSRYPDKIEHIQQESEEQDRAQRDSLLNEIRARYRPEDTWVQLIESDIFILDTDIREVVKNHEIGVSWQALNAVRKPGTWKGWDTYPNWNCSIREVMPYAHYMETMLYTFRPLPLLSYSHFQWRPWPAGFSNYVGDKPLKSRATYPESPLLFHVGYRGPTHFYLKYKHMGPRHRKYKNWDLTSPETVEKTVAFFNGDWNSGVGLVEASRKGWIDWLNRI